ncbi:MAG: acyl-CoA dehydrogenase, partial [Comamonadaceae bacterium]
EGQGQYRLTGTKRFSTGSAVGDALLVTAAARGGARDGQLAFLVLQNGHQGVEYLSDWDHLGQRLSSSNSVRYHDVRVEASDILGWLTDDAFASLITPGIQLAFGNLYLGIAEGALARGREITNARKNAWFLSKSTQYRNDPFIQRTYGEFVARVAALAALAERVNHRFDEVVGQGHAVTAELRGALEIEVAQLKVVATETALDVAHRIYETTGSSSTASGVGLDLYWRNVRTHSLHDPVDYKKLEVGAHYLNGALQPVSLYT